jgi:hypothetical protein
MKTFKRWSLALKKMKKKNRIHIRIVLNFTILYCYALYELNPNDIMNE